MKRIVVVLIVAISFNTVKSQLKEFMVCTYTYDFDNKFDYLADINVKISEIYRDSVGGSNLSHSERYLNKIKQVGFNTIFIYNHLKIFNKQENLAYNKPSTDFLSRCSDAGLSVILQCPELSFMSADEMYTYNDLFSSHFGTPDYRIKAANSGVNYWRNKNEILGWSLGDEPFLLSLLSEQHAIDGLSIQNIASNTISNTAPTKLRYINEIGGSSKTYSDLYDIYDNLMNNSNPNLISFDYYPIARFNSDINTDKHLRFFSSLQVLSDISAAYNVPFGSTITHYKHFNKYENEPNSFDAGDEAKSIEEFRYVIYSALIYGAKALFYWPKDWYAEHSFDRYVDGLTKLELKSIHEKLVDASYKLLNMHDVKVYHKTKKDGYSLKQSEIPDIAMWTDNTQTDEIIQKYFLYSAINEYFDNDEEYLAISTMKGENENDYMWVFNKNISESVNVVPRLKQDVFMYDVLNKSEVNNNFRLEPGEAKLFQFSCHLPSSISICNKQLNGLVDDYVNSFINLGEENCSQTFSDDSNLNFWAEDVTIVNSDIQGYVQISAIADLEACSSFKEAMSKEKENYLNKPLENEKIRVFPNPAEDILRIVDIDESVSEITFCTQIGTILWTYQMCEQNELVIDISNLASGIYFIKIIDTKSQYLKTIIKE